MVVTLDCLLELPIRGMFSDREMGLMVVSWVVYFVMGMEPSGWSILVKKYILESLILLICNRTG